MDTLPCLRKQNEIENENLYRTLLTMDKRTLQIVLPKIQDYSTKETVPIVHLTTTLFFIGGLYAEYFVCMSRGTDRHKFQISSFGRAFQHPQSIG